ncbi:MAG: CBS domain-containing protein [Methanomicrobiales archaeon]|nr:CBS domain-containing protein [Methanomicrobiales archaeon]MDI6877408.1 CBS domain-containing protein [Methanomicrobiales archaeon]
MQFETRVPLREVMRSRATTIDADASVARAAEMMCRDEVGSCIVLQRNMPTGIVTEEDINCKVVAKDLKPSSVPVRQIMSTPLITIGADKTVGDAAHLMVSKRVRRLPVVEGQKVVGIVTVRDILSIATVMNDIMAELITINREEPVEMGVCSRCGIMSDDLRRVDDQLILCPTCREEERLV